MKYKATFNGRTMGAIGIFYLISDTVEAENEEQARLKLYDKYDHITMLKLIPIIDNCETIEGRGENV